MFEYLFTFRSLTPAQSGKNLLAGAGLWVQLERSSKRISSQGCGYVLRVQAAGGMRALALLQSNKIPFSHMYRQFQHGGLEEMRL